MGKTVKSKMIRDSFTESVWQTLEKNPVAASSGIDANTVYDVLIVGAGITGITAALLLQKAGKKCVIAEGYSIGFGTTGGTTAHLNTFFDATYNQVESDFGQDAAKLWAKAGNEGLSIIKDHIDRYQINCDFEEKDGYLFSQNEKETKELKDILKSSQNVGVAVAEVERNGVPVPFEQSLLFEAQAQFHPLKYILHLAEEFKKLGGIISENTFIRSTEFKNDILIATTDEFTIKAKNIIYATHIPPGINLLSLRCAPYRSYAIGIKLNDDAYPDCLSYDMKDPYHYFRSHVIEGEKVLILGGEDHKTGHADPEESFANLEDYAKQHFNVRSILYRWSAQYYSSVDGLPYIGRLPAGDDRIYIATGYNGNGMQLGTISAKIISDLILGVENEYENLFLPSRMKPIAGFAEFVKENADVAYRFVADRFSAEEIDSLKEIKSGEGKIVDFKDQKLAVYRDGEGKVTALNPVCTHAKCIVNFNKEERSWDCPCHGGRFDLEGKVVTGPPRQDLQQIDLSK